MTVKTALRFSELKPEAESIHHGVEILVSFRRATQQKSMPRFIFSLVAHTLRRP